MFLCTACEAKLEVGQINVYDIEVSRVLYELFGDEASFHRAIDTEDYVILLTESRDVGKIIGKSGANIKLLSKRLGKKVRVVGEDDFEEMVKAFIAPARVRGINTVYLENGVQAVRVRVDERDRDKLRIGLADLKRLVAGITDTQVELTFD
jgi:transcription antitermination factor NusA-like protein